MSQRYVINEAVLAVFTSGYVHGWIDPRLKDYKEKRNILKNVSVAETAIQRVFACEEFGRNKAMISSVVVKQDKCRTHISAMDRKDTTTVLFEGKWTILKENMRFYNTWTARDRLVVSIKNFAVYVSVGVPQLK